MTVSELTAREREIADAVHAGLNKAEIAKRFGISPNTVKAYVSRIYDRLGIKKQTELVLAVERARAVAK